MIFDVFLINNGVVLIVCKWVVEFERQRERERERETEREGEGERLIFFVIFA